MRATQPIVKAKRVAITNVITTKGIGRLVDKKSWAQDLLLLLLGDEASAGSRRATSSLLLSSSMVIPEGERRRLCTSVRFLLGHILLILRKLGLRSNPEVFRGINRDNKGARWSFDAYGAVVDAIEPLAVAVGLGSRV
jgi:hypothetical protein